MRDVCGWMESAMNWCMAREQGDVGLIDRAMGISAVHVVADRVRFASSAVR